MAATNEPAVTVEIAPGVPMDFVLVRPGAFIMGDEKKGDDDEKPEHLVRITQSFYLGRYPVTQAQWRAVMGDNPASFQGDDRRPVESVSWNDIVGSGSAAKGFLQRLAQVPGHVYRLPTEAEWEYAAKGGHLAPSMGRNKTENMATVANLYPAYAGGEDINAAAWHYLNDCYSTMRVGCRQPNALGLYGMSGNVYEWCQDTFDGEAYANRTKNQQVIADPFVEESDRYRVLRGGSWFYHPWYCLSAYRVNRHPSARFEVLGFRLVLDRSGSLRKF